MFSLVVAYMSANIFYQNQIHEYVQKVFFGNAEKIINAYDSTPNVEFVPFIQNFNGITGTKIQLFDNEGLPLLVTGTEMNIDKEMIRQVLSGEQVEHIHTKNQMIPMIGVPVTEDGNNYAMFITVEPDEAEGEIMNSMHLMYVIILFLGSFLILIAARFIVRPIIQLTEATKGLAKGEFKHHIETKRKDEIGTLSNSFNEMAKELEKLDRMRQEFVSNVSHEIQSPLTSISGFSKALRQKKMSEESQNRYLSIIEEESNRLSRLARNLLQLSTLQHEQTSLNVSSFRLDEQLRNVVIALEPQWIAKEIKFDIELESITLSADQDQLKQVWTNLLNNAIKFTPEKGKIMIEGKVKEGQAVISITDNGIGIPEHERKDIFKPFHKVDKSRNSSTKGNGLGLSIMKKIIELHHGDVEVTTGFKETGTTFIIKIPI